MLTFPTAKLNLGLHVTARRPDGFHDLETVLVPLPWTDALEVVPAAAGQASQINLTGRPIPGTPAHNLCLLAYERLRPDFPHLPPVQIHLHKLVPIGAGLGGGSADAAFMLKALNDLFELSLTTEKLEDYARHLGSDCAFFIRNQPVLARERGDVFAPIDVNLAGMTCVVVYPNLPISTAEAYARIVPGPPATDLRTALTQPIADWRKTVKNDFETALTPVYPVLSAISQQLYDAGAAYASLSGSGSAVYGLFPDAAAAGPQSWPAAYTVWQGVL